MCVFPRRPSAGSSAALLGSALLAVCCLMEVCMPVNGDYNVEVRVFNYSNPTGRCRVCPRENGGMGRRSCCDDFERFGDCDNDRRCDSYFIYCLRPFGMTRGNCTGFTQRMSGTNINDVSTDFSQSSEVLGLANPFLLPGLTTGYNKSIGVQVHVQVIDDDSGPGSGPGNRIGNDEPDEEVDTLRINHSLAVGESTQRQTFSGRANLVSMDLNITVFCDENFQEPDCTQCVTGFTGPDCLEVDNCVGVNCSGRGQCVDGVDSFNCSCDPGFTGDTCQTNIDDCVGAQNCSGNGQCVDGVNSFTCQCSPGYSGTICDSEVPTVEAGRATGALVGGVIGGLIAVAILAALLVAFALLAFKWTNHKGKGFGQGKLSKNGSRPLPGDNPIYDGGTVANESKDVLPVPLSLIKTASEVDGHVRSDTEEQEREMDNPIYGTEDAEGIQDNVYSVPFEEQGQEDGHKFENPIYGDEDEAEGNTYSVPYDSSRPSYTSP